VTVSELAPDPKEYPGALPHMLKPGSLLSRRRHTAVATPSGDAQAQPAPQHPNILFIMADDIGLMMVAAYHRAIAPNIDRTQYYAMQSCTYPLRTGMIPPQLPGSPSYLRPGTPALSKFLLDLGYNTGEFGKNHLGDGLPPNTEFGCGRAITAWASERCAWPIAMRTRGRCGGRGARSGG
jgi:hypothetical protein